MQSTKRPLGVWILLVFFGVSVVWTPLKSGLIYSKRLPASGTAAEYLQTSGALTLSLAVIGWMLTVAFVVSLFRMRRVAITIFTVYIVLAVISLLWGIFFTNYLSFFTGADLVVTVVVSVAVLGVFYLYLRALGRQGQLT
jgi:hypothetical protein